MTPRPSRPRSAEATVRIGSVAAIPEVLRNLGVDPAEVLAEAGLETKLFADGDNTISCGIRGHLVGLRVAGTGCGHFGLLIGRRRGLEGLDRTASGERRLTAEPRTGFLKRAWVRFLSILPIEWLL